MSEMPKCIWASNNTPLATKPSGDWHTSPYGTKYVRADLLEDRNMIAAAPELAKAAEAFSKAYQDCLDETDPDGATLWESSFSMYLTVGDVRRLVRALAKARGKT